jgi:hypothetical protein
VLVEIAHELVLPRLRARGATLYLIHPPAKNVPARVAAFRDYVAAFAKRKRPRQ